MPVLVNTDECRTFSHNVKVESIIDTTISLMYVNIIIIIIIYFLLDHLTSFELMCVCMRVCVCACVRKNERAFYDRIHVHYMNTEYCYA